MLSIMKGKSQNIALQRIQVLLELARKVNQDRSDLAQRYLELARKIAMSVRLHLPKEHRLNFCRHCKSFILPGVNSRVRIQTHREHHIVRTCMFCGRYSRIPFQRRKKND